jgi:hypothetical protein
MTGVLIQFIWHVGPLLVSYALPSNPAVTCALFLKRESDLLVLSPVVDVYSCSSDEAIRHSGVLY